MIIFHRMNGCANVSCRYECNNYTSHRWHCCNVVFKLPLKQMKGQLAAFIKLLKCETEFLCRFTLQFIQPGIIEEGICLNTTHRSA